MSKSQKVVLAGLMMISLALNLVGIQWGLPSQYHFVSYQGDEHAYLNMLRQMNPNELDFHPGNFRIGGGVPYTLAAAVLAAKLMGWVEITSSSAYYYDHIGEWAKMYLIGRGISTLSVTLSVLVIYLILRELYSNKSKWLALFGAALVTVMPGMVINAHFVSYNTPVVFWIGLSVYFLLRLLKTGQWRDYIAAGLTIGIGMAFRYTAGNLIPFLAIVHFLRRGSKWRDGLIYRQLGRLASGYAGMAIGFFAFMPYALLDLATFVREMWWAMRYATPLGLPFGQRMYNLFIGGFMPLGLGWSTYILALGGLFWLLIKRGKSRGEIVILIWLLPSLLIAMNAFTPVVGRILPILYVLVVPAVGLVEAFYHRTQWGAIAMALAVALLSAGSSFKADAFFLTDTVRSDASEWILDNVPKGTTIGLIYDAPYWDSPDVLNQLYYHPERTGNLYSLMIYEQDGDALYENPPQYLVVTHRQYRSQPNAKDLLAQYEVVAEFKPWVDVGRISLWYYIQCATEIRVFRWVGPEGSGVPVEEMCKGW